MKTTPIVRSEILGLFGSTLTADHRYSRHRCLKLRQKVQTLLSQKWGTFSGIFIAFSKSIKNFGHSKTKDKLHSLNISEFIDSDKCVYFNARKLLF